ncbi:unnamed protein product, partial [Brassica oleracea]
AFVDQRRCILRDIPPTIGSSPKQGPFTTKFFIRRTPVISVGTSKRFATTRFRYPLDGQLRLPESCHHEPFGQFPHR